MISSNVATAYWKIVVILDVKSHYKVDNYLTFFLDEIYCIPFRSLYIDKNRTEIKNSYIINWSFIYFITQRPKYRFLGPAIKTADNVIATIKSSFGEKFVVEVNVDYLAGVRESFDWIRQFQPKEYSKLKKPTPIYFDILNVTETVLSLYVNNSILEYRVDVDIEKFMLCAEPTQPTLRNLAPLEIVYIGQTLKKEKRFLKHEKLQKAVSLCPEKMEIHIWPTIFRTFLLTSKVSNTKAIFEANNGDLDVDPNKIDLLEKMLIHFFQPRYNMLAKSLSVQDRTIEYFRDRGTGGVGINWGTVEPFAFLQSSSQKTLQTDQAFLNFDHFSDGYDSDFFYYDNGLRISAPLEFEQEMTKKYRKDFVDSNGEKIVYWKKP